MLNALFVNSVIAQDPPVLKAKIYQEGDKIFVQKQLPIYLSIRSSEDGENFNLNSTQNPSDASPMYFDTEGVNYIRSRWAVDPETKAYTIPRREVLLPVYADGLAPVTSINFDKIKDMKKQGATLLSNSPLNVIFESSDALSGVDSTYVSINGSAYNTLTNNQTTLADENKFMLDYRSSDNVGNLENANKLSVILDFTSPVSSHEIAGNHIENILSGEASLLLSLTHPEKTNYYKQSGEIKYIIDGASEKKYIGANSILMRYLAEGDHKISYQSVDFVNNVEKTKTYSFFVDKSAPQITISYDNSYTKNQTVFVSGQTEFQLDAFDNKAGVENIYYNIDGKEFAVYDGEPFQLNSNNGKTTIAYYAVDKVGNSNKKDSRLNLRQQFFVDRNMPIMIEKIIKGSSFFLRNTTFVNAETKIGVIATDGNGAGVKEVKYLVDDSNDVLDPEDVKKMKLYDATTGAGVETLPEGSHAFTFYAIDHVANQGKLKVPFSIDNKGPEIDIDFGVKEIASRMDSNGKEIAVYPKTVVVFINATDDYVGYKQMFYKINGGKELLYTTPLGSFKKGENYTIEVRALDNLGNESINQFSFGIDE